MAGIRKPLRREVEDGFELFKATPEGIVEWARTTRGPERRRRRGTRPAPPRGGNHQRQGCRGGRA
ncbi:MAG: hypothetical protein ACRDSN_10190, partial [Pseudonocardiaceae bacterium]